MARTLALTVLSCLLLAGALAARPLEPGNPIKTITILHINDMHNRIEPASRTAASCRRQDDDNGLCYGGFARLATAIKQERLLDPELLLVDAGDQFSGTVYDTLYRGQATAAFQNAINETVMTVGNHEFDWGPANLAEYASKLDFPLLGACNMDISNEPVLDQLVEKWYTVIVRGIRVVFFGVITDTTSAISSPGPNIIFKDPIQGIKDCLAEFNAQNTKDKEYLKILIAHDGYELDQDIARQVPELDLIIGGHSHTFLYGSPNTAAAGPRLLSADANSGDIPLGPYPTIITANPTPTTTKDIPVVQAFFASRYMGKIVLQVDKRNHSIQSINGSPILIGGSASSSSYDRDAAVDAMVQELAAPVQAFTSQVIGSLGGTVALTRSRAEESTMGAFVCEKTIEHLKTKTNFEAVNGPIEFALHNSGGLRADINVGNITVGDIITVLPFGNVLAVKKLTGWQLKQAIQSGVSVTDGRFPQVAGLRFVYKGSGSGARVVRLTNDAGVPLNLCQQYFLATNNFVANGGDFYSVIGAAPYVLETGQPMDAVVLEEVREDTPILAKDLSVYATRRIKRCEAATFLDSDPDKAFCTTPDLPETAPVCP